MAELRMWSVTELIGGGIPKPQIGNWIARTTAETAVRKSAAWRAILEADGEDAAIGWLRDAQWRSSGKAADRGTAIHAAAQALVLGAPVPPDALEHAHVEQFMRFLADFKPEYLAAEAPVYNLTYRYAGTLDAIVKVAGRVCVLDYKTTDKGPEAKSRPPYAEVALQLAAYAHAECLGTGPANIAEIRRRRYYTFDPDNDPSTPLPRIDGALALMISPVDYELRPVRIDDSVWRSFLYACEVSRWMYETSRTALGGVIDPPKRNEAAILADAEQLKGEGVLVEDDGSFEAFMAQPGQEAT